eukprot:361172-Prorocentrum_minimum.AAC.1
MVDMIAKLQLQRREPSREEAERDERARRRAELEATGARMRNQRARSNHQHRRNKHANSQREAEHERGAHPAQVPEAPRQRGAAWRAGPTRADGPHPPRPQFPRQVRRGGGGGAPLHGARAYPGGAGPAAPGGRPRRPPGCVTSHPYHNTHPRNVHPCVTPTTTSPGADIQTFLTPKL